MGKSPGKWIKTLLFGKKSSKATAGKGKEALNPTNDKVGWITNRGQVAEISTCSPSISHPVLNTSEIRGYEIELEKESPSKLSKSEVTARGDSGRIVDPAVSEVSERFRQAQAATKAQAAFRGYLARRAFRALRGIIRLQALVRGHLVRRQAIATLYCLQGIVKLQALVRGRRIRVSDMGFEVCKKGGQQNILEIKHLDPSALRERLSKNAFICKLLAPSPVPLPIRIQYAKGEANSAWTWLERWTKTSFWRQSAQQTKMVTDSKAQEQGIDNAEFGQPKSNIPKNISSHTSFGSTLMTSESEKPKRNPRKFSSSPAADPVQENPQIEVEKIKQNLRKVSTSTVELHLDKPEVEPEKPKRISRKTSNSLSDFADHNVSAGKTKKNHNVSAEKSKIDHNVAVERPPDVEITPLKLLTTDEPNQVSCDDQPGFQLLPLENRGNAGNMPLTNEDLRSKEEPIIQENMKISKRRASLSAKADENGLPSSPTLPSYMAATESAKAKLRGQGSPRFRLDGGEKNGLTRRHSLPTSTGGKTSSPSPRAQRLVQANGKGVNRSDRSLLSSRDGNEKVATEWRR